jgi:hypothetical protein
MMRLMASARKQTRAIAPHQRGRKDPAAGVLFPPTLAPAHQPIVDGVTQHAARRLNACSENSCGSGGTFPCITCFILTM